MPLLLVLCATLPGAALAAQPAAWDEELRAVPAEAELVMGSDHAELSKAAYYKDMLRLAANQGWDGGLGVDLGCGVSPGTDVRRSLAFRVPDRTQGVVVMGALDGAKLATCFKAKLGEAFETGVEAGGGTWFSVTPKMRATELAKGMLLIAPPMLLPKALEAWRGGKPGLGGSARFKRLVEQAGAQAGAPVWVVGLVSDKKREALRKEGHVELADVQAMTVKGVGTAGMTFRMVGVTASVAEAQAVARTVRDKVDRKIGGVLLVGPWVASRIVVTHEGTDAVGTMAVSAGEMALLARHGGLLAAALK
jgi:hypothetical protein